MKILSRSNDRSRNYPGDLAAWLRISAASGIAYPGFDYTFDNPEPGFNTPESPQSKRGCLKNFRPVPVNGRQGGSWNITACSRVIPGPGIG
jgi:hypothetical protein